MLKWVLCSSLRFPCTSGILPGQGRASMHLRAMNLPKVESSICFKSFMLSQSCSSQTLIISPFQLNRRFTLLNSGSATRMAAVFYPVPLIFCQAHNAWLISVCSKGCSYLFLLSAIKYILFDLIAQHLYLESFFLPVIFYIVNIQKELLCSSGKCNFSSLVLLLLMNRFHSFWCTSVCVPLPPSHAKIRVYWF